MRATASVAAYTRTMDAVKASAPGFEAPLKPGNGCRLAAQHPQPYRLPPLHPAGCCLSIKVIASRVLGPRAVEPGCTYCGGCCQRQPAGAAALLLHNLSNNRNCIAALFIYLLSATAIDELSDRQQLSHAVILFAAGPLCRAVAALGAAATGLVQPAATPRQSCALPLLSSTGQPSAPAISRPDVCAGAKRCQQAVQLSAACRLLERVPPMQHTSSCMHLLGVLLQRCPQLLKQAGCGSDKLCFIRRQWPCIWGPPATRDRPAFSILMKSIAAGGGGSDQPSGWAVFRSPSCTM